METSKEHIKRITDRVFNKVLQEILEKPTWGRGRVGKKPDFCYYQPHAFRRYYDFSHEGFNHTEPRYNLGVGWGRFQTRKREHDDLVLKDFWGCTIIVRKQSIDIRNLVDHKKWFTIKLEPAEGIHNQVAKIIQAKEAECRQALEKFIECYGGKSEFKLLKEFSDDKIMHEQKINLLPLNMKFNTPIVKKQYNEPNVEFSSPVYAATYLETRAIERVLPSLQDQLNEIQKAIYAQSRNIHPLIEKPGVLSTPRLYGLTESELAILREM